MHSFRKIWAMVLTMALVFTMMPLMPVYADEPEFEVVNNVEYIDENGNTQTRDGVKVLTDASDISLEGGWYLAPDALLLKNLSLSGEVHIVVENDFHLKGINHSENSNINAIDCNGHTFSIYSKGEDGRLLIEEDAYPGTIHPSAVLGNIRVNSGEVWVKGNSLTGFSGGTPDLLVGGSGIEGDVELRGGILRVWGGDSSGGSGGEAIVGNVTQRGGSLIVKGGNATKISAGAGIRGNVELHEGYLQVQGGGVYDSNIADDLNGGFAISGETKIYGGKLQALGGKGYGSGGDGKAFGVGVVFSQGLYYSDSVHIYDTRNGMSYSANISERNDMEGKVIGPATPWSELQSRIHASLGTAGSPAVIELEEDVPGTEDYGMLVIPNDKYVKLDLKGHTIDRGLADWKTDPQGGVIYVDGGNLTLDDSVGGGKITGGNATSWPVDSGYLSGKVTTGGGVTVEAGGSFTMEGGVISGNVGTLGGGVCVEDGTFYMTGGKIQNNRASLSGGGVYVFGGGGTVKISGNPNITGNMVNRHTENMYLDDAKIQVEGSLDSTASIGIGGIRGDKTFTNNLDSGGTGAIDRFTCDLSATREILQDGTEAKLSYKYAVTGSGTEADPYIITEWGQLSDYLEKHASSNSANPTHFKLMADIISIDDGYPHVWIYDGTYVNIDLNGFVIDVNCGEPVVDFAVLCRGDLTITDSNPLRDHSPELYYIDQVEKRKVVVKGGGITGGYTTGPDGSAPINIVSGKFNLKGGSLVNNFGGSWSGSNYMTLVATASAVYVDSDSEFNLDGGNILGNNCTGDCTVCNYGKFIFKSGSISGNYMYAGPAVKNGGEFIMDGGTIEDNLCYEERTGGVENSGIFTMRAGSIINNRAGASDDANGLGCGGLLSNNNAQTTLDSGEISGNMRRTRSGNYSDSNIGLEAGGKLTLGANFSPAKPIDIDMEAPGVFTVGGTYADKEAARAHFTSAKEGYGVYVEGGQAKLMAFPVHQINVTGGTASPTSACEGVKVNISANVPAGKTFDKWITTSGITFENENEVGTSFIMPDAEVTVEALFKDQPESSGGRHKKSHVIEKQVKILTEADVLAMFKDLKPGAWYLKHVVWAVSNNLMQGTGDCFEPESPLTRGQTAMLIYNLEFKPDLVEKSGIAFEDVKPGDWYYHAVMWMAGAGIAKGDGSRFKPKEAITREQLVTLLYSYGKYKKLDVAADGKEEILKKFKDANRVSSWAREAMGWALSAGIITGNTAPDGSLQLDPKGLATRGQMAAIFQRFCKLNQ